MALACFGLMPLSRGLPGPDGASRSGRGRPTRSADRRPVGKPGHPLRRLRLWLVRPPASRDGWPARADLASPRRRIAPERPVATQYRTDWFPVRAKYLVVPASAEVHGHQVPSGLPIETPCLVANLSRRLFGRISVQFCSM